MPKTASEKCRLCAKLDMAAVMVKHGPEGSGCYVGPKCRKRRTYYRNRDRYNEKKRKQYRQHTGKEPVTLHVAMPSTTWAELLLYRTTVDAPLHAIAAELRQSQWHDNEQRMVETLIAQIEPIHAKGLKPAQVREVMRNVLHSFSGQLQGVALEKFEVQKELSPDLCPVCREKLYS